MTVADERGAERAVASQPADVRLVEVTKRFDDVFAVDHLSLEIERGESEQDAAVGQRAFLLVVGLRRPARKDLSRHASERS